MDAHADTLAAWTRPRYCYRHPDRETGLSCSECGRPICYECMTPAPVGLRCPEHSGKPQGIQQGDRARCTGVGARRASNVVTLTLIAINVAVYLAELAGGGTRRRRSTTGSSTTARCSRPARTRRAASRRCRPTRSCPGIHLDRRRARRVVADDHRRLPALRAVPPRDQHVLALLRAARCSSR